MQKITMFAMHLNHGGIERYTSVFCEMFHNDYELELIVTYKDVDKPVYEIPKNVQIKYLVNDSLYKISNKELLKKGKVFSVIKEILRRKYLQKIAIKKNIEEIKSLTTDYIVTTRMYHTQLINKYYHGDAITIATEHNYHNNDNKYINKFISSVTNFNYVVHCTNELYTFFKDKIKGPKNIFIPNAVALKNEKKSKINNKNIISVGRLSPEKGFLDLIDVMKIVKEIDSSIHLTICGDGQLRKSINEKIKEYKLENNIELTGFLNTNELKTKYLDSSLFILCSYTEAFGLVLLEAMHFGLPCIAFDSASGARELLSNDVGVLIKNRDKKGMADTIVKLLNSQEGLKEYQKECINKINNYSLENIKKEWVEKIFSGD